jgi:hypothetical protein
MNGPVIDTGFFPDQSVRVGAQSSHRTELLKDGDLFFNGIVRDA